jgi:hypothetical protein
MNMYSNAIGTILVKVIITMSDCSCARHTGRYYNVKEAMDIACYAFPEASGISCTNLGAAA